MYADIESETCALCHVNVTDFGLHQVLWIDVVVNRPMSAVLKNLGVDFT